MDAYIAGKLSVNMKCIADLYAQQFESLLRADSEEVAGKINKEFSHKREFYTKNIELLESELEAVRASSKLPIKSSSQVISDAKKYQRFLENGVDKYKNDEKITIDENREKKEERSTISRERLMEMCGIGN